VRGVIFAILASFAWGLAPILFKLGLRAEVSKKIVGVFLIVIFGLGITLLSLSKQ
jgi:EamA domain-containing membrane protein RarD